MAQDDSPKGRADKRGGAEAPSQGPPAGRSPPPLAVAVRLHQTGRLNEAQTIYRRLLEADPDNAEVLSLAGLLAHQTGRDEPAIGLLRKAIARRPDFVPAHVNLGMVLRGIGRLDDAAAQFRQATSLRPDYAAAHNNLGLVLRELGRPDEAITCFERALLIDSRFADAHNNLGLALQELGRLDAALDRYRKALKHDSGLAEAHNNMATVLKAQGDLEGAVACCRRALAIRSDFADAHVTLGQSLEAQGRLDAAKRALERAISCAPGLVAARAGLGDVLRQSGDYEAAAEQFRQALLLEPGNVPIRWEFVHALERADPIGYRPAFAEEIERCFRSADIQDQDLALPAIRQIKAKYDLDRAPPPFADARALLAARRRVFEDPLTIHVLERTINQDQVLEKVLTGARRAFLSAYRDAEAAPIADLWHLSRLAQQCFNNEYVFWVGPEERAAVGAIESLLDEALAANPAPDAGLELKLLLFAMYAPLHRLSNGRSLLRVPIEAWKPPLGPVLRRTLHEIAEETEIAASVESLTPVDDRTSRAVRAMYEENPYPRWLSIARQHRVRLGRQLVELFPHFAPPSFLDGRLNVLVAGCGTGQHPTILACHYEDADVLAVDLSRRSLAYGIRMASRLGVSNIRFRHADILNLAVLDREFDFIDSVGVLHHMKRPVDGWSVLTGLLRPGGVMRIGLYSEKARQVIVKARRRIERRGLPGDDDGIRRFRRQVMKEGAAGPLGILLKREDFYSASRCRDLVFHVMEHRFTLPEIDRIIRGQGLRFLGFERLSKTLVRDYRRHFPDDPEMCDLAAWEKFEDRYPGRIRGYTFWLQKPLSG
ncbi:MAG: tetratricopeptide repeat protein [Alphaproteobacteria bacterium]